MKGRKEKCMDSATKRQLRGHTVGGIMQLLLTDGNRW